MSRLLSMIALVVVLAGLGAYIYFVDANRPAGGVEEKDKVFSVQADALQEITVTVENETSTLRKVDSTWQLTAPLQADADQSAVSSLSSSLASLEVNRVVDENAASLAEYGLENPRVRIAFKTEGDGGALHLGDKTPTQSDIYAVRPGERRVFLVPAYHETTFAKKPFDLRDKRILSFERDKIEGLEIVHDGPMIQLARADSEWTVVQPAQARGDYSAIEGLITRLASASMTRLVESAAAPATLAKYGLDKPTARITMSAGSTRTTLSVGREDDDAFFAHDTGRGLIFTIDSTLAEDLRKPVDEYRDKNLFELRSFNVARLRVTRSADTTEFQKVPESGGTAEKWQRVMGDTAADVEAAKMDDFLTKLTGLRAQSFVASTPATGLAQPALVVSASYDDGKFERVRMVKTTEAFASRDGEAGAAKLDGAAYDDVLTAYDALLAPAAPPEAAPAPGNSTPNPAPPATPPAS